MIQFFASQFKLSILCRHSEQSVRTGQCDFSEKQQRALACQVQSARWDIAYGTTSTLEQHQYASGTHETPLSQRTTALTYCKAGVNSNHDLPWSLTVQTWLGEDATFAWHSPDGCPRE